MLSMYNSSRNEVTRFTRVWIKSPNNAHGRIC